jgi:transcriptional regulator with XRE-family HTH domain
MFDEEFSLASALIKARADAGMVQSQVAAAMGTTQAAVAWRDSGRVRPTTRTPQQIAKATQTRLRIDRRPGLGELGSAPSASPVRSVSG